ncbi:hypothetical protein BX666DRAFT_1989162 [Dichotomocladium elegans]|nr:hypothetical protein BX666DRAFT_1989162 [Dichotomocladium elegans]
MQLPVFYLSNPDQGWFKFCPHAPDAGCRHKMFSPLQHHIEYENAVEMPMTPTESSSPFKAFSPIANAVRHAIKDGTRQWRRNFESFSQMTRSSPEVAKEYECPASPHRFNTARSPHRANSNMDDRNDDESTSLTPAFEQQSLSSSADNTSFETGLPELRYRESLFGSPRRSFTSGSIAVTPSLRSNSPMPTLSPASHRSRSAIDYSESRFERHALAAPYHSPSRSLRSRYSLSNPSIANRSRPALSTRNPSGDELRRLDRLQEKLHAIEQVV